MLAIGIVGWGVLGALVGAFTRRLADRITRTQRVHRSIASPLVLEATTATLFAGLAWRSEAEPQLLAYIWLAAVGVPLAAIDLAIGHLPNQLILPSYPILIGLFGFAAVVDHSGSAMLRALAGMVILAMFNLALYLIAPGQLGGGDVKLSGLLGLALGWTGWSAVLTGTLLGWLLAALTHLVLRFTGRSFSDRRVRLGPFLIAGAIATLVIAGPA